MSHIASRPVEFCESRWHLVLLVAITVTVWSPALSGTFHYDDLPNTVLDQATSNWDALLTRLGNGFRPLLRLSFAADRTLWGFTPAGFLATNLTLHILTVIAIWRLALHRLCEPRAALLAALIFAVQPAHAAVVAWTSGRSTGLSTLLLCVALLAHERSTLERGRLWSATSLLCMMLAVAAKEVALIFPAIVLLWEITRPTRLERRTLIQRVLPSALLAIVLLVFMLVVSAHLRELLTFSFALASPAEALLDHVRAIPISLSLWFRPWALAIEHLQPEGTLALVLGASTLVAMVSLSIGALRRHPLLALALLWPLVMLLPSHSLISRLDLVVEKPLYAAWIGPSLVLGAFVVTSLHAPTLTFPLRVTTAIFVVSLLMTAHWRAWVWADPVALWREASEAAPQSARAWNNRAVAALGSRNIEDGRFALERLRVLNPSNPDLEDLELTLNLITPPSKEALPQ